MAKLSQSECFKLFCGFDRELQITVSRLLVIARRMFAAERLTISCKKYTASAGAETQTREAVESNRILLELDKGRQLALGLKRKQKPKKSELALFETFAHAMTEQALEAWEWQKQAMTDSLTGLGNRRFLMHALKEIFQRAKQQKTRITLIRVYIDNLTEYNDRWGHEAGDEALKKVGNILRSSTRNYDVVTRVGGDEFEIVLWQNSPRRRAGSEHDLTVEKIINRIRRASKSHLKSEEPDKKKMLGSITLSMGLANFPQDAKSLKELMRKADVAMRRAKSAGKNRLVLWKEARKKEDS
jgi:diguanylate cyclase (GGDEF)-like protein